MRAIVVCTQSLSLISTSTTSSMPKSSDFGKVPSEDHQCFIDWVCVIAPCFTHTMSDTNKDSCIATTPAIHGIQELKILHRPLAVESTKRNVYFAFLRIAILCYDFNSSYSGVR